LLADHRFVIDLHRTESATGMKNHHQTRQEAERVGWWWKALVNARRLTTWPPILSIIP